MVKGLKSISLKLEYNTDEDDIVRDLYSPCFRVSKKYDRAVGYFRANIYRELGIDLLEFSIKGGKIRIVCSPDIAEKDEKYAREGYELRGKRKTGEIHQTLVNSFKIMEKNPSEKDCLEMLRLLIEVGTLDLYVAVRTGGIYHRKIGLFTDNFNNKVLFTGSGNETPSGIGSIEDWSNDEDFDLYRSWGDLFEQRKLSIKESHLINLFSGKSGRTTVRPLNSVEREYLKRFRKYSSLEECKKGALNRTLISQLEVNEDIRPYIYQIMGIQAWYDNNNQGILSMPTGTGKTFTALFSIEFFLKKGKTVLIVVPSSILLNQWDKEIRKIYKNVPIMLVGAGNNWRENPYKSFFISPINKPKIILSTMASASSTDFLEYFSQSENPILIADEVHRLGSKTYRKILEVPFTAKLGLSATPERLFDEEGNNIIKNAFNQEPVYKLTLDSMVQLDENDEKLVPIIGNFLSKYEYYFYAVDLDDEEKENWNNLSEELRKKYAIVKSAKNESYVKDLNESILSLLIKRSRIAKKCREKTRIISKIIKEKYPSNGRWIIYCEDREQMDEIFSNLKTNYPDVIILRYHSKMVSAEKRRVLKVFEATPGIVISIRCLDEGVDIPSADGAVIIASSTNPRQYIQRRGRVLRKAYGKREATIIDVLVLPKTDERNIPYSIVSSELARAWSFSQHAINQEVSHELWKLCMERDIQVTEILDIGIEEDKEEIEE